MENRIEKDTPEKCPPCDISIQNQCSNKGHQNHPENLCHHKDSRIANGAYEKVFTAAIRVEEIVAGEEDFKVLCPDVATILHQKIIATCEGIGKIEEHRTEDKDAKNQEIRQHEKIRHAFNTNSILEC